MPPSAVLLADFPRVINTWANRLAISRVRVGLSEDQLKALILFINISREKSTTNALSNWVFKLDKRPQFTPADAWVESHLGRYLSTMGERVRIDKFADGLGLSV